VRNGWRAPVAGVLAVCLAACPAPRSIRAAPSSAARFTLVPLGTSGGLLEEDLSAFLLAPAGSSAFVCLDAGVLLSGIRRAVGRGAFDGLLPVERDGLSAEGWVLARGIRAYLLSHPHLDHVAGLVIASPEDGPKPILARTDTLAAIGSHLFNWTIWPNFTSEGAAPVGKYALVALEPGREVAIPETSLAVEPFILSHATADGSTAFLVRHDMDFVLYLGDTGPDALEGAGRLRAVWERVAPLVRDGRLHAILLEASFPNERPDADLHGHLTPAWMVRELHRLAALVRPGGEATALRGLTVVVTHVKPSLRAGRDARREIARQLADANDLGVRFVLPEQGVRMEL
jgi:3',5'-cyclic-nucleotide phosphodiesterase